MAKKVAKKIVKKVAKKKTKKAKAPKMPKPIGIVTHFYGNISVAIVKFNKPMKAGTEVHFRGATTDLLQTIDSMQYDHKETKVAKKGQEVGIKVSDKVRDGDEVYLAQ